MYHNTINQRCVSLKLHLQASQWSLSQNTQTRTTSAYSICLLSSASQWALRLAPVARKATSSHPPFFFWDVRRLVRPTGLVGHSVMSCPASTVCEGCSRPFLLRSEILFPVCQRSILTIASYHGWTSQVSSYFLTELLGLHLPVNIKKSPPKKSSYT